MTTSTSHIVQWNSQEMTDSVLGRPRRPMAGDTVTRTSTAFTTAGDAVSAGTWEASAGQFRSDTTGYIEFCHIVEGSCRVVDPDGTVHALKAGDSFVMPEGYKGHWEVDERVKKVFFTTDVPTASAA